MSTKFKVINTLNFSKQVTKLVRSNQSLRNKLFRAINKLEIDPFQGERIEETGELGERRIWVGDDHRLFYDIDGQNVVLLHIKKKDKHTYR